MKIIFIVLFREVKRECAARGAAELVRNVASGKSLHVASFCPNIYI